MRPLPSPRQRPNGPNLEHQSSPAGGCVFKQVPKSPKRSRMILSREILRKPLAIVGMYPPPYGGVGTHLKRLLAHLDRSELDYVFYNTGPTPCEHPRVTNVGWSLRWYLALLIKSRHQIIHFHTGRWWVRLAAALLGWRPGRTILFTAHSYFFCEDFLKGNRLRRWLVQQAVKRCRVIAVNGLIRDELLKIGLEPASVPLIPAFIPPPATGENDSVSNQVKDFCRDKSPILLATGAFVKRAGEDLYGLEMLVNMMCSVLRTFPRAGLVVYMGGMLRSDESDFKDLLARLEAEPLKSHVLLHRSREEFHPALHLADVFVRPTRADGDAVSVREALHLGVPSVVSDAAPRPEGVVLFKSGDQLEFEQAVRAVLADLSRHKQSVRRRQQTNPALDLIALYKSILSS